MKEKIVLTLLIITTLAYGQERELNISINGGVTIGNIEPTSKIAFGADANYLFDLFDDFKAGPSLGLVYFNPKEDFDTYMYLPIGAAIRFQSIEDQFYVGIDLGFAIGVSPDGDNGGIYLKPMVGYNISDNFSVNLFYSGIKKKLPTYAYIGLGLTFNIFGDGNGYYSY